MNIYIYIILYIVYEYLASQNRCLVLMMLQKQLFSQLFIWLKPLIYLDVEDESQEIFSHKSQTFGPTRWQTQTSNPTQVVATQIFFEFSSLLGEDEPNLTSILG